MKAQLLELRRKLDRMYRNESPKDIVVETRNNELARIFKDREDTLDAGIRNLSKARQDVIDQATYKPKDDTESLARRLRVESELSAMSRGALLKFETEDPEILSMKASTLRKRGLHDEADETFAKIEQAKQAPYLSPVVKGLEKEIVRFQLLKPSADPYKLWIGSDVKNIKPEDIANVDKQTGRISFKDSDGSVVEV